MKKEGECQEKILKFVDPEDGPPHQASWGHFDLGIFKHWVRVFKVEINPKLKSYFLVEK
jgi:hypothetical protein